VTQTSTDESLQPVSPPPKRRTWGSLAALGALLALKAKSVLAFLKLASLGKFLLTGLSMATMVWFEAVRGGWVFAIGFVLIIFIHEMGHAVAIRRAGLRSGWPVFIPFFGALISLKDRPPNASVEAAIAYGGPLFGTAASLAAAALYFATGSRVWLAVAYSGFFLNLFNLVPVSPLDGGRVAQAFSRRAWIVGAILLGGMFLVTMAPQLLLIGLMALPHIRQRRQAVEQTPAATPEQQSSWSLRYFGLCFFLGGCMFLSHRLLQGQAFE
jgi:Zn-dependent protease